MSFGALARILASGLGDRVLGELERRMSPLSSQTTQAKLIGRSGSG